MSIIYTIFGFLSFWTTVVIVLIALVNNVPANDWFAWVFRREWLAREYLRFCSRYYIADRLREINYMTARYDTYPRRKMQAMYTKIWEKRFASRYAGWTYNWAEQTLTQAERTL